jgi:hypothetical protein
MTPGRAVKLIREGRSIDAAAPGGVRLVGQKQGDRVGAALVGGLNGAGDKVATPGEMEFSRLRVGRIRLKQENGIL